MSDTIYAVCHECAHVEPRPAHAEDDWFPCEKCGDDRPALFRDLDDAEQASQAFIDSWQADDPTDEHGVPLDFTGEMRVGNGHEQEIAADPWAALYYEPGERADDVGPAVAARVIAGWCHGGQSSALYSFASSGHLDRDACVRELDAMRPEPPECAVELATFLRGLDLSSAPVAYRYADPTEDERFVYDEDEAREIASEDPSLIVWPSSPRWNLVTRTLRAKEGLS